MTNKKKRISGAKLIFIFAVLAFLVTGGLLIKTMYDIKYASDYASTEELKIALEENSWTEGQTADVTVISSEENPVYGTTIWLADDIVLAGYVDGNVPPGAEIQVEIERAEFLFGVWFITYKFI